MSIWKSPHIPWDSPGHLVVWTLIAIALAIVAHVAERAWKASRARS